MEGDLPSTNRRVRIDLQKLISFYGFNRREAKVALLFAEGKRLDEVAEDLKITYETVRKHLRNIFNKTGTDRQAMLVKQILMSPATTIEDANVFHRARLRSSRSIIGRA
jgi:DNA-binding CsgD family transcriptional regulator